MLIRAAFEADVPQLLVLMRELADFEDYLAEFAVDEGALLRNAFGPAAQCQVFVAESQGTLLGYAVAQLIAFTYDLRPTARLKELYVATPWRSRNLGRQLLSVLARWALEHGAGRLHWDVLNGNLRAEAFYHRLGGRPVRKWLAYEMDDATLQSLARG